MATKLPARRRWVIAARWPAGVAFTAWRYMWTTTPVHRWTMGGLWPEDAPPELPADLEHDDLQTLEDGTGPLLHRIYRTRIVAAPTGAREVIGRLVEDMNSVAPTEFASFHRVEGDGPMRVGDDYVVRMPGPWDGPVTVVAADETSFRLATLRGHLEAGQIEFRAEEDHRGIVFEIEAWARSGDRLSDLFYTRLRISKEIQLHMWASVLRNVVKLAGGKMAGGIVITTRQVESRDILVEEEGELPEGRDARALADVARRPDNLDPGAPDPRLGDSGWRIDEMVEPLPHERPGPGEPAGSWATARRIMDDYQLADPRVVTGVFRTDVPLAGRPMLLKIHYGPLRFRVGVRIGDVHEKRVELDGRPVELYGWSYRTLEGHFEEGEMLYELRKWLDTGDVEFRLHAVSRPARSGPFLPRTGFRLVGRNQQLRFYRQICRRLRRLTEAQLETARARAGAERHPGDAQPVPARLRPDYLEGS
jgi:uncharacterized protein (UPF0548 family)